MHESLRELYLYDNDLSDLLDLRFVEKLPSLVKLDLSWCYLASAFLSTLSGIETHESLKELDLSGNNFSASLDLGFVARLPSLKRLILRNCNLTSACLNTLSGIKTHKSLRVLYLYGNNLSDLLDLGFVAKLPSLVKLVLLHCNLTSASLNTLSEIETHESLRELDLYGNNLSDLSDLRFVEKLPSLEILNLEYCNLTPACLNTLSGIESLRELDLCDNDFSGLLDLRFVEKLPSLEKLVLSSCNLTPACLNTLSGIKTHKNLRELDLLCNNDFSGLLDLVFIEKLPSLEKLVLFRCNLTSACLNTLSGIKTHKNLRELDLLCNNDFSGLLDLVFIARLPSLEKLYLSNCRLTSASLKTLSGIERHESLRVLDLDNNDFSDLLDLRFIAKLPSLEKLVLSNCRLTSVSLKTLSEIETHESLRELDLSGNNLSNLSDFAFITKLSSLKELNLSYCELTPESKSRILELMKGRERNLMF